MRNRALIAHWALEHSDGNVSLTTKDGKTYLHIKDYPALRQSFAHLLAEIQRIKSEGDFEAARQLVEAYAVDVDENLLQEVLQRYKRLNIAPYKGFINPVMKPITNEKGEVTDINLDFSETYVQQMLRYGRDYATL